MGRASRVVERGRTIVKVRYKVYEEAADYQELWYLTDHSFFRLAKKALNYS